MKGMKIMKGRTYVTASKKWGQIRRTREPHYKVFYDVISIKTYKVESSIFKSFVVFMVKHESFSTPFLIGFTNEFIKSGITRPGKKKC